jgi:hypothetical protein
MTARHLPLALPKGLTPALVDGFLKPIVTVALATGVLDGGYLLFIRALSWILSVLPQTTELLPGAGSARPGDELKELGRMLLDVVSTGLGLGQIVFITVLMARVLPLVAGSFDGKVPASGALSKHSPRWWPLLVFELLRFASVWLPVWLVATTTQHGFGEAPFGMQQRFMPGFAVAQVLGQAVGTSGATQPSQVWTLVLAAVLAVCALKLRLNLVLVPWFVAVDGLSLREAAARSIGAVRGRELSILLAWAGLSVVSLVFGQFCMAVMVLPVVGLPMASMTTTLVNLVLALWLFGVIHHQVRTPSATG